MQLLYYVVNPAAGTCEAVVQYPITDPLAPNASKTATVTLNQATDLANNPAYTDQDVANAVATVAKLSTGSVAVPTPPQPAPVGQQQAAPVAGS